MRTCVDCGTSIDDRGISAYLCRQCVKARASQRRARWRGQNQEHSRTYQREWSRAHPAPRKVRVFTCPDCLKVFKVLGPGGTPQDRLCPPCSAFHAREQKRLHHRAWEKRNRLRENAKARARYARRRLRRAA